MTNLWELSKRNPFRNPCHQASQERKLSCASTDGSCTYYAAELLLPTVCVCDALLFSLSAEQHSCEFGSSKYYAICGFGGILSCGLTHTAVVPLDLVKCRMQVSG